MENYPQNRVTPRFIDKLEKNEIFVFGSNLEGNHGGGAARTALKWGAIPGEGVGLQGQTYAIPTMFRTTRYIKEYVEEFIRFAGEHSEYIFLVTEIGCGIAGFSPREIAPLFKDAIPVENIHLPARFWEVL
ncbi:MAG: hypothetical protein AB2L20_13045 [Mangrovibacterium sp.]